MKPVTVLMLVAFPLYCYAGSGCSFLEEVIAKAANASVSTTEYRASLEEFINDENTANAVDKLKQCFLNQSVETLSNFNVMMVISAFSDVFRTMGQGQAGSKSVTDYAKASDECALFL
uniref:Mammaglobin-A-like n=1 Tax=Balaenoptera musculus TaxID=9771 RepID=A0A8C0CUS0_BALMU